MSACFNYRRMRRFICPRNERRYKFACVVMIFILHALLYVYIVFGSSKLINVSLSRIIFGRLLSYRQTCDLDFSKKDWTIDPNTTWELLEKEFAFNLSLGGRYKPRENIAKDDIVIVVPYRNREQQLKTFIRYMHKYLQCKRLAYQIVIVEMTPGVNFNRALLLNIGFIETLKRRNQDCFIFHDVDLLPESIITPYSCERSPLHMAVAIDTKNYTLPYLSFFGGIYALKREHFLRINGHSNQYFGWGGEDDDFHDRLKLSDLLIHRLPEDEGRYHMLPHADEKPNPQKMDLFKTMRARRTVDGLNTLKYQLVKFELKPLYTWIMVDVKESDIMTFSREQLIIINKELSKNNFTLQRNSRHRYKKKTTKSTS